MTCDGKQKEKLNFDYDNFYHLQGQADSYYRNLAVKNKCLMLIRHDKAQNVSTASSFKTFKSSGLVVQTSRPVHFHTDGDGKGISDRFEINVEPNCLKLLY